MSSEIRVNKINNRAGLGTITIADTGVVVNGIVTCTEVSGLNVLNIAGVSTFANTLDINGDIDVDGHTNLDNLSVAGVSTFSDNITLNGGLVASSSVTAGQIIVGSGVTIESNQVATGQATFTGIVTASSFRGDGSQLTGVTSVGGNTGVDFNDNVKVRLGTGNDLEIYYDGTDGWIKNVGKLKIESTNDQIEVRGDIIYLRNRAANQNYFYAANNAFVGLTYAGDMRLETESTGIKFRKRLDPETDSTVDLGTNAKRWRNIYADTYYGDGSNLTGITGTTINSNADNRVITGSGTANTLNAESNLTYNGQKLNLGTVDGGADVIFALRNTNASGFGAYISGGNNNSQYILRLDDKDQNECFRVTGDGNVGILNGSPQRKLHIGNSGYSESNIRIQGGSDYAEIRVKDSDNNLSFHHNVGGAGSRELFNSNGSTGHFSINCYSYQALTITTNENGTNGPEIQLMHNSASPAANDTIGQIRYSGKDSAGDTTLFSKIETKATTVTNGSETGHIDFSTRGGGAYNSMFRLSARGTASAPSYTTDDMNGIILDTYNTGNPYPRYFNFIAKAAGNTDSNIGFWTEAVGGSPTQKMTIDASGTITKPLHPVFATRINYVNSYVSSGTKVQMKAAHIDTRSSFSDANDRYVAPAAGRYLFYFFSNIDYNGDGTIAVIFKKNGSDFTGSEGGHIYSYAQNSGWHGLCGQIITNMAVNDYIEVFTSANNMKVDGNNYGQFGGYMIG